MVNHQQQPGAFPPSSICPVCKTPITSQDSSVCDSCGLVFASYQAVDAGAPLPPPGADTARPQPGQTLAGGRYTVQRVLSKGGMGMIYLATDHMAFDRTVVVKAMLDYFDPHNPEEAQQARQNFLSEARTLASLRHPAIPQIYTFFQDGAHNFIVMEYIEGRNLEQSLTAIDAATGQIVPGSAYPYEQVVRWGVALCRVLEYLASRQPYPVVHHDIKPANLLLDQHSGEVRLVDFGTAKARLLVRAAPGADRRRSSTYGTQGYAAPEQYRGESEPRSDVYALAATLYHLATDDDPCQHPFAFPRLAELGPLGTLLEAALAHDVRQRPTALALRQQMERLLAPAGLAPIQTPDGIAVANERELADWCIAHWEQALSWVYGRLPDQLELLWGKNQLAAAARALVQQHADNHDAGLDAFVRVLYPSLPPPQVEVTPPTLTYGRLAADRLAQTLTITNNGPGYAQLTIQSSDWLVPRASWLGIRPRQQAVFTVAAVMPPQQSSGLIHALLTIQPAHGPALTVPASAEIGFTMPDGQFLPDEQAVVAWCEANPAKAIDWLYSIRPNGLWAQLEHVWGRAREAGDLRRMMYSKHRYDAMDLDRALVLLDPHGFGAAQPQLQSDPERVDIGRLSASVSFALSLTNVGRRAVAVWFEHDPWIICDRRRLELSPGERASQKLRVNLAEVPLRGPISTTVHVRHAQGDLAVIPVQAHASLARRLWLRYPAWITGAIVALCLLLVMIGASIVPEQIRAAHYRAGVAAMEQSAWEEARREFELVLASAPDYQDTVARLSEIYYQLARAAVVAEQQDAAVAAAVGLRRVDAGSTRLADLLQEFPALAAAVRQADVRRWQAGAVPPPEKIDTTHRMHCCVAFSPDGRLLATGGGSSEMGKFDAVMLRWVDSGAPLPGQIFSSSKVEDLAFSPDGRLLAAITSDAAFEIYDIGMRRLLLRRSVEGEGARLAFSPDSQTLAVGTGEGAISLWQVSDGTERLRLQFPAAEQAAKVTQLAYSSDGQFLVVAGYGGTISVLANGQDTPRYSLRLESAGEIGNVTDVTFSPDSQLLAVAYDSGNVRFWRLNEQAPAGTPIQYKRILSRIAFSADGQTLATGSIDGEVVLWRMSDRTPLQIIQGAGQGSADQIVAIAFSPDGQTLAAARYRDNVLIWRAGQN